jgi:hypothetical protein
LLGVLSAKKAADGARRPPTSKKMAESKTLLVDFNPTGDHVTVELGE